MKARKHTKLVHEGSYAAEVDVELIDSEDAWGPYLSVEDVSKLDEVRRALKREDLAAALSLARVYRLTPIKAD
ncbi:MAG: hypothetical protein WBF17_20565 [Phycisphaerae bacterium]|jgi:hypothetical protein